MFVRRTDFKIFSNGTFISQGKGQAGAWKCLTHLKDRPKKVCPPLNQRGKYIYKKSMCDLLGVVHTNTQIYWAWSSIESTFALYGIRILI